VLAIALGVGTTVLGLKVKEQRATQQAVKEATFASSHTAQKMSTYDYRTLDADLKAASALTTGKLHTQYGKLAEELKTVAVPRQAISNTTVMKVGVVSATPDKVVTLVYANRSSATKDDKEQRLPESLRMKMTMVKKDGKWLASEVVLLS
jgi:Mce-associated membrane protein